MRTHPDIALLAPVPFEHLEDALNVIEDLGKVAFGSMAFQFFRDLEEDRGGLAIKTFIYASHRDVRDLSVTWQGLYIGSEENREPVRYRPPSTLRLDGKNAWGTYWIVKDLRRLDPPIPIADLCSYATGESYGKGFVPEGPMRIERPRD